MSKSKFLQGVISYKNGVEHNLGRDTLNRIVPSYNIYTHILIPSWTRTNLTVYTFTSGMNFLYYLATEIRTNAMDFLRCLWTILRNYLIVFWNFFQWVLDNLEVIQSYCTPTKHTSKRNTFSLWLSVYLKYCANRNYWLNCINWKHKSKLPRIKIHQTKSRHSVTTQSP